MDTCTTCGGSGIQRVSGQRFRTCLPCLGTGQISASGQPAPIHLHTAPETTLTPLSVVARSGR